MKKRTSTAWMFVEFLIIMVGVLAALGVDAVMSFRNDRQAELEYLNSLRAELQNDSAGFSFVIDQHQDSVLLSVFAEIESGTTVDTVDLVGRLRMVTTPRTMPPNRTVFDEIVSTGSLRLIRDIRTRRAVASYYEWYEHMQPLDDEMESYGTFASGRLLSPHIDGLAWAQIARVYGHMVQPEQGDLLELRRTLDALQPPLVDLTSLGADPEVRSHVARIAEGYALQRNLYGLALSQARRALELISLTVEGS